jgi:hypothetical protein
MIILSVGMPRAGSGWYYNLTNDLMMANGACDAHQIRHRYHLQNILTEVNCNIGVLSIRRVLAVLPASLLGNTFVIKAHAAPSPFALMVIRWGLIKPTYIYRDPRDAMLSAMENGQRAIQRGHPNAFSPYADFEEALRFMTGYLHVWESWEKVGQALTVRYEDLLTNYDFEIDRLCQFLKLDLVKEENRRVIEKYRPEKAQTDQKGMHFRHGKIGRFRQKMDPEQQTVVTEQFSRYLSRMGYPT